MRLHTEPMLIRLTPELRDTIATLANEERRPLTSMARLLIERGLSMTDLRNNTAAKARGAKRGGK